jgi:hypothetical protein
VKIALSAALPAALVLMLAAVSVPATAASVQPLAGLRTLSSTTPVETAKKSKAAKKTTKGKKARARSR